MYTYIYIYIYTYIHIHIHTSVTCEGPRTPGSESALPFGDHPELETIIYIYIYICILYIYIERERQIHYIYIYIYIYIRMYYRRSLQIRARRGGLPNLSSSTPSLSAWLPMDLQIKECKDALLISIGDRAEHLSNCCGTARKIVQAVVCVPS